MYLYGASGHAKVIIDILRANHEPIEALFDDNEEIHCLFDYPVLRPSKVCGPLIISIGNNGIRRKIAKELKVEYGKKAFHPSAIISEETEIRRLGSYAGGNCAVGCLYWQPLYYQYRCFGGS